MEFRVDYLNRAIILKFIIDCTTKRIIPYSPTTLLYTYAKLRAITMKKLGIGLLGLLAGVVVAAGLAIVPAMTYTASAATASTGAFGDSSIGFAAATGSASSSGPSGSSSGFAAGCPDFFASGGTCSESAP
jgi:hypothetical protein